MPDKFLVRVVNELKEIIVSFLQLIRKMLSLKFIFTILPWYFSYLSKWNMVVVIISGVNTFLLLWIREVQKSPSNLAEILKIWLGKRKELSNGTDST